MKLTIQQVSRCDKPRVVATLAAAFQNDPVSRWLFPDPEDRAIRHLEFFDIYTDLAMDSGEVYATENFTAVALWIDIEPGLRREPPQLASRLRTACGHNHSRFLELDKRMAAAHPVAVPHSYLAFVGVDPSHQRRGLGAALIRSRLDELDQDGFPSHLDASSEASLDLYERLGYRVLPNPICLSDGPVMWPMWRDAGAG